MYLIHSLVLWWAGALSGWALFESISVNLLCVMLCECPYFFFFFFEDGFYPAAPPSTPPFFQQAFSSSPAAGEIWQVENEPAGRAILSQLDTVMIADADWTASHSHPGVSVWTVMSKTCEKPAGYYQFPLCELFSQCLKIHALKNLQCKFMGPLAFIRFI